jgi:hypothetical protein
VLERTDELTCLVLQSKLVLVNFRIEFNTWSLLVLCMTLFTAYGLGPEDNCLCSPSYFSDRDVFVFCFASSTKHFHDSIFNLIFKNFGLSSDNALKPYHYIMEVKRG